MTPNQTSQPSPPRPRDHFLVCGLGSLGQHSVVNLKSFGVEVSAVEQAPPKHWEVPHLPTLLDRLIIGDCCRDSVLEEAGVKTCRGILLVTENERVNLEAALTARVLNPSIRLVLRSDKANLNQILSLQLENLVAFEPGQLAAPAFALSAYGESLLGFFRIQNYQFQVVKQQLMPTHRWVNRRRLHELDTRRRRLLRHIPGGQPAAAQPQADSPSSQFYTWHPDRAVEAGDEVVTIVADLDRGLPPLRPQRPVRSQLRQNLNWRRLQQFWQRCWRASIRHQLRRVALLCGLAVILLCVVGTLLIYWTSPEPGLTLVQSFYAAAILLLGGYGDLFEQLVLVTPYPWTVQLFGLVLTLVGTAFIGVLYALLTEKLLTLKFEFLARRPPIPERGHVVVLWLGPVGKRVVQLLQDLQQSVVAVAQDSLTADLPPDIPLVTGDMIAGLAQCNLPTAKSVVAVSEDEIQNLELGLMAYRTNPDCRLIIRTYDQQFTDKVAQLFPYTQVLCASALSAEAFAAAAFGEQVISLFRLYHQTVLVTQYDVEANDTLCVHLLGEVAHGYGVVPIWHRSPGKTAILMPSDDIQLRVGDSLVVLSTIRGLRRIEQGWMPPRRWYVHVRSCLTQEAGFEGAAELVRVCGCSMAEARDFMAHLPAQFPTPLYRHQALRLVRLLQRSQVEAEAIATGPPTGFPPSST